MEDICNNWDLVLAGEFFWKAGGRIGEHIQWICGSVIEASERGDGTQAELAESFGVSVSWVEKLVRQRRETNSIAPKPHGGGRSAIVRGKALERLKACVQENPGATLEELRRKCRISGSIMCVFRALQRLGITRKKSPFATPNN